MTKTKINGEWVTTSSGEQIWTGTKAQLAAGLANGTIPEGAKVMVTNDYDGGSIPVGVVEAYMGATAPEGWLLCDGSTFDTTVYPKLYELLGKDTVPDLRGKFTEGTPDGGTLGTDVEAGLPNITGNSYGGRNSSGLPSQAPAGAIKQDDDSAKGLFETNGVTTYMVGGQIRFNASWSNPIYGKSTTVQPPAVLVNYIIRAE